MSDTQVIVRVDGQGAIDSDASQWLNQQSLFDNRLRVVYGRRQLGNFGSLSKIFAATDSDYLIQLDADDKLHPQAVELAVDKLETNRTLSFVYTNCFEIDADDQILGLGPRQALAYTHNGMLAQFITFHMRCIRRSSYEAVGGYRCAFPYCGDYDLSLRLAEVGAVGYISLPLYFYRVHDANTSTLKIEATTTEGFSVARNALYRRGLAHRYYLKCSKSGDVCLIDWEQRYICLTGRDSHNIGIVSPFDVWLL